MTTETPAVTASAADIVSNWRGSETTRQKVQAQIRERFGEEAAAAYDPLRNCFTFNLWLKKGFCVKKGEKALQSVTIVEKKDAQGNITQKYPKKVSLFFKSQVEPVSPSSSSSV